MRSLIPITYMVTLLNMWIMLSTSGSTLQVTFVGINKHIDNICSRANSSRGFIRRNVNIGNPRVKGLAYQSYVRPVLEYSPTVWDPYTVGSIKKIESVQRRAARFTLWRYRRTSSVNAMLTRLSWESLASIGGMLQGSLCFTRFTTAW